MFKQFFWKELSRSNRSVPFKTTSQQFAWLEMIWICCRPIRIYQRSL
jgi:hypothetical protein